jgi:plasmid stabilization system protein ParE
MQIDFHPEATQELEDSADWYAARSGDAARGFALAVDEALDNIASYPYRFFRIDDRHRACSLKRYPFQVVYRNDDSRIYVIAIAHAKRRPGYWRERDLP